MNRRNLFMAGVGLMLAAAGAFATQRVFAADLRRARARLVNRSALVSSRFGPVEYGVAGSGRPVLMIHGSGGGFDQGLAAAPRLVEAGYQVIAPSRFGYLRSAFPEDPSSENQADAFVDMFDALGIERAPVIGASAGALSALQFALRHPDRCAALVAVVPAAYAPSTSLQRPPSPLAGAIFEHALKSDFLFWLGLVAAEREMIKTVLATDPQLVDIASATEKSRVRQMLWNILPVSQRADGLANDARLAGNPAQMPLEDIRTPTLAISLEDDRYGTFAAAQHIAAAAPGARLVSYPTGGHVWVGHDADMFAEIHAFLGEH
jgi:pimeloyl-ACP methyl ester carboxylesterase